MKIPVRSPFYFIYLLFLYALQMKKLYSVLISAALGACIISCSGTSRHESLHDQAHIETYKEAWRKFNTAGQDSALIAYTRPILYRALRQKDTLTALYCGTYMAQAWLFMEQTDSTAALLEQMRRDIALQDDNILKYLYWSICGGYAIKAELNYTKAMEYYSRSYEYSVASGDVSRQLGILMDIIYIFYIRSDGNGMKYAEQACSLAHNEGMPLEDRCAADMMMAMMHHINGNDRTALSYIDSAADMAEKGGYLTLYPLIYKVYGDVWTSSARYSEAERNYSRALRYTGYTDAGIETMIYLDYGRMLQKAGDYGKAERILEQGLEISYRNDNHECRKELLSSLIDNALHSRDSLRLAALAGNYRSYLDSVSNLQREREFNSMLMSMQRVEYENIAQAAELEYLRSRQRLLANMAVLTLIAVVAIFLLVLYRRQRNTYKLLVEKYQQYADQFNKEKEKTKTAGTDKSAQSNTDRADRELFERVETLMQEQKTYRMKSLTRDSLAEMLGTNRTYLSRAINNMSGKSFSDYINTWRVIEATRIMSDRSMDIPLKQLADDLGYSSTSVFYRSFQKETGVTAGKYMKEVRAMHEGQKYADIDDDSAKLPD